MKLLKPLPSYQPEEREIEAFLNAIVCDRQKCSQKIRAHTVFLHDAQEFDNDF